MLTEDFYSLIRSTLQEDGGLAPHRGMSLEDDGVPTERIIDLNYPDLIRNFWEVVEGGAKEVIYAFDVFTKPGQGTSLSDAVIVVHWVRDLSDPYSRKLRVGVIEYCPDPFTVLEISWENSHWSNAVREEWIPRGR